MRGQHGKRKLQQALVGLAGVDAHTARLDCRCLARSMGLATLLVQAVLNIALNALHAVGGGGPISVRCSSSGGWVLLKVEDSGCGIAKAQLSRLFSTYRPVANDGDGLGLATTRRIVEQLGGAIDVSSELGVGTVVVVALPART